VRDGVRDDRFRRALLVIVAVGLAVRIAFVLYWRHHVESTADGYNDSAFYHLGSLLLADGHGFVNPFFSAPGHYYQSADHPPVYWSFLAAFAKLGLRSAFQQMLITAAFIGTPAVWLVGVAGRAIAGARTGLVAAAFAALLPTMWSWDAMLLSEPTAILAVALTMWAAYRYRAEPTARRAVILGAAAAVAAMSRAELVLFLPLIVLPLVVRHGAGGARGAAQRFGLAAIAVAVIIGPWAGYNISRFVHPVYLSNGFDITVSSATCDLTYYGPYTGYWHYFCANTVRVQIDREHPPLVVHANGKTYRVPALDQSQDQVYFHHAWVDYVKQHESRLPLVVLARWGRITGLFRPWQQARLEWNPEGRPLWVTRFALLVWYPVALLAAAGAVALRRRRIMVYPLLVVLLTVLITTAMAFGTTRYRASAEPAMCLLAAAGVVALWDRWASRRRDAALQ
jgi:4-amino-4-deoxy-L-arabinose transferase-like glycosyltransferase